MRITMDQKELAMRRRYLNEQNRQYSSAFVEIAKDTWPAPLPFDKQVRVAVWRNREFLVQGFAESNGITRLSINRTMLDRTGDWQQGLSWDELQTIKSALGYGDRDAVEVYPPDRDVVNATNMRHLWIFPKDARLSFPWRDHKGTGAKLGCRAADFLLEVQP